MTSVPAGQLDDVATPLPRAERPLRRAAIHGSLWTLGGYGASQGLRLLSNVVLAWLLFREAFGLMALVTVFMQGLKMFSDVGIGPSIIQNRRGEDPAFLNTAWTIQIIRGVALSLIACLLAWPMAALYAKNDPLAWQLLYLIPVAGLGSLISGFNSPALYTLNRNLRLGRLTIREIGSQFVTLVVAVAVALIHPSVWALVAGGLAGSLYTLVVSHRLAPEIRVRLQWDAESTGELIRFGKWVFLSTAFTFLASNLDKIVLGSVLTFAELGLYAIAVVFAKVALRVVWRLTQSVVFPLLSRFRDDPERMVLKCLEARQITLVAGGAICVGFSIMAPWFFQVLYPAEFAGAGVIAQWISIYMWCMILVMTIDRVPLALGQSRTTFLVSVINTIGIGTAVLGYVLEGLPGFIVGMSLGPLAGLVYLNCWFPLLRWRLALQSLSITLMWGSYAAVSLGVCVLAEPHLSEMARFALAALLAVSQGVAAGAYVYPRLRGRNEYRDYGGSRSAAAA